MRLLHFIQVANSNLDKIRCCMDPSEYERFMTYVKLMMSRNSGQFYYFSPEFPALHNSHITPFVPFSEWYLVQKFGIELPKLNTQWIEVFV